MVPLLVPEEQWGPQSWGVNHPLYVEAQIHHGLKEAKYGYWGFSPSNNPDGGYREYGVDPIGLEPNGYASDQERTFVDYGFEGCRPGRARRRPPTAAASSRRTPRSSRSTSRRDGGAQEPRQAAHATSTRTAPAASTTRSTSSTGKVSRYYLALDQGMIMAAIANDAPATTVSRRTSRSEIEAARPAADRTWRSSLPGSAPARDWDARIGRRREASRRPRPRCRRPPASAPSPGAGQVTLRWEPRRPARSATSSTARRRRTARSSASTTAAATCSPSRARLLRHDRRARARRAGTRSRRSPRPRRRRSRASCPSRSRRARWPATPRRSTRVVRADRPAGRLDPVWHMIGSEHLSLR